MKKLLWLSASALYFFANSSFAASAMNLYKSDGALASENSWFIGIGGGLGWNDFDKSTTTVSNGSGATPPMNSDLFTINKPSSSNVGQLNIGYRWHQPKKFLPYYQVYLQYRHYNSTGVVGTVEQYSLPEFLNYAYRVDYEAELYTINGKFDLVQAERFMPYVMVGGGFLVTHLYDYTESAYPPVTARYSPAYRGGTTTSPVLTAGLGVDVVLTKNFWLTLGYDHVFQGRVQTGDGTQAWSDTHLNFGNVSSDTVFLNLTAKFPDGFTKES